MIEMFSIIVLFLIQCLTINASIESNDFREYFIPYYPYEVGQTSKLLIILVDGFRWDYVSRDTTLKGFPLIAKNGVRAQYVKPIFPENSYPNWYSITTGLYAESHGMIQNYIYDNITNEIFLMSPHLNASHIHWWNQTEPIWVTAEKMDVKTAMYVWDGCQVMIRDTKPTVCVEYQPFYKFDLAEKETRTHVDKILDDFSNDKYRLALLYHEYVDHIGHSNGPLSEELKQAVQQIDGIIYDLYQSIKRLKLDESVNVVIVSDHGMTQIDDFKPINLTDVLDFDNIQLFLGGGSGAQIMPKQDKEELVYQQLLKIKGIKVYKKKDIPQSFHYENNRLVLPILVTTDFGYQMLTPSIPNKVYPFHLGPPSASKGGNHGYNADQVKDMRAIMYGFGPDFKKNYISEPLAQVDHYNLFCHLLRMPPNPNNGTLSRIKSFLKHFD